MSNEHFHHSYNSPDADLVIECKDGVRFRVHSYILMAHSEYFRAMPSHAASPVGDSPKMIDMNCKSHHLALLLGMIDKTGQQPSDWNQLTRILEIGERYQFKHVADLVRHRAGVFVNASNAEDILKFAGSHDFPDLAQTAIVGFGRHVLMRDVDYDEVHFSLFRGVPGRYGAAFIVAMAKHKKVRGLSDVTRWQRISAAFDVSG